MLDQKGVLPLTSVVRTLWSPLGPGGQNKWVACVNWEDERCWHSALGTPAWAPRGGLYKHCCQWWAIDCAHFSVMKWERRNRFHIMLKKKNNILLLSSSCGLDCRSNKKLVKISRKSIIELSAIENITWTTLSNLCFPKYFNGKRWECS